MKAYKVIKPMNLIKYWTPELENFEGQVIKDSELDYNPYICDDDNWFIIRTGDTSTIDEWVPPITIHSSCLEEIKLCTCNRFDVVNFGCSCGGA